MRYVNDEKKKQERSGGSADVSEQFVINTINTFLPKASSLADAITMAANYLSVPRGDIQAIADSWDLTEAKEKSQEPVEYILEDDVLLPGTDILIEKGDKIILFNKASLKKEELDWNDDEPLSRRGIKVPEWINQDFSQADAAAVIQGGCESGAYMPAVTYHMALKTMNDYGDDVFQFIEDSYGEIPEFDRRRMSMTWATLATFYLSIAVESFASQVESQLDNGRY